MPEIPTSQEKVNTRPKRPIIRGAVTRSIKAVCNLYGCTPEVLLGPSRTHPLVYWRMLACWLSRQLNVSYAEIGRRMGGRDHTTVRNGCFLVEDRRAADPGFYVLTEWLLAELLTPSQIAPEPPPAPAPPEPALPPPAPKKAARHDLWGAGTNFYGDPAIDPRASYAFLEQQNERFLAALAESGEWP
jgi:hypothetical protein